MREAQHQSSTMADSPNKTHQHGHQIVAMSECCLGNVPDEEVSFPIEQNTIHQIIAHSPHGMSAKNAHVAKNCLCFAAEQACGVKVPNANEKMRLNLLQHSKALAQEISMHPVLVKSEAMLPQRLLWCLLLKEEREGHKPAHGWLSHAVQSSIKASPERRTIIVWDCVEHCKNHPHAMHKRDNQVL